MKQPDLFDLPAIPDRYPNGPGWTEPTTSKAAAESIRIYASVQQQRIIDFLEGCGEVGATYHQIADGTGMLTASICGRMVELVTAKRVTIATFKRKTPSGRDARVYLLARTQ